MGSAKRPIGDCLEGLVQMLSPLFVQRTYSAGSFLVKQVSLLFVHLLNHCLHTAACISEEGKDNVKLT